MQLITSQNPDAPSRTVKQYVTINGSGDGPWVTAEAGAELVVPTDGYFKRLVVRIETAAGVGAAYKFIVRKNGADTSCTCTISGNSTKVAVSSVGTSLYSAGDRISLACDPTTLAGTPNATMVSWDIEWSPVVANEMIFMSTSGATNLANSAFMPINSQLNGGNATEKNVYSYSPLDTCDVTKMYVLLTTAPGAGTSRTFTFRVNSADTTMAVTISNTNTSGNNVADVNTFVGGDTIDTSSARSGVPAASSVKISYCYTPTTYPGEFMINMLTVDTIGTTTSYMALGQGNETWDSSSANRQEYISGNFMITKMYVWVDVVPGAGSSRIVKTLRNGVDIGFNCTLGAADLTKTYTGPVVFTGGNSSCQIQASTSGAPPSQRVGVAYRAIYLPPAMGLHIN